MILYAQNVQIVYMAILKALNYKKIKIPAISPTFFANVAKMCGVEVELIDTNLDFSSSGANIVQNFFETYEPKCDVVFQNYGDLVGEAKIYVMKKEGCVKVICKDEEIFEKIEIFLNGGIKRGRLWNYDLISYGIKDVSAPCDEDSLKAKIIKSNEKVKFLNSSFEKNPYFDILKVGKKTLKDEYPVLLKPALYCPKEDIYIELKEKGFDVKVRFKPLYKLTLFKNKTLPISEELYKAVLILPLKKDLVEPLFEVLEKYRYRGCVF